MAPEARDRAHGQHRREAVGGGCHLGRIQDCQTPRSGGSHLAGPERTLPGVSGCLLWATLSGQPGTRVLQARACLSCPRLARVLLPPLSWIQGKPEGPEGGHRGDAGTIWGDAHWAPQACCCSARDPATSSDPAATCPIPVRADEAPTHPSLGRAAAPVVRSSGCQGSPSALHQHKHHSTRSGRGRRHLCPQVNGDAGEHGSRGSRWAGSSLQAGAGARSYTGGEAQPVARGGPRT